MPLLNALGNAIEVAFDSHRERGVLILDNTTRLAVYEWDGHRWTPRIEGGFGPIANANTARHHAIVFDPARRHTVMLTSGVQEAWGWDGQSWSALAPPPFMPQEWSMAFDEAVQQVVVYEPSILGGINRTWHFDGISWLQVAADTTTGYRSTMAYDQLRGRMVLRSSNETFEWSGGTWVGGLTNTVPPLALSALYDPQRGKVILPAAGGTQWEWDGSDWVPFATPATTVGPNRTGMFFFDEHRHELVMYDDWTGSTLAMTPTSGWVLRQRLPGSGGSLQLSADHARTEVVAVETASVSPTPPPTTLRWTPAGWQSLGSLGLPLRFGAAQANRDLQGVIYRFGGAPAWLQPPTDDLWAFDGSTWTQITAPNPPAGRTRGVLTVDVTRQRLVLFGGYGNFYWNDTREFDGTQWIEHFPAHTPSPRRGHLMCWASNIGRVVLFGGHEAPNGQQVRDFWAWDGTDWSQLPAPPLPAPVQLVTLADHPASSQVVLSLGATQSQAPTWGFDSMTWSPIDSAPVGPMVVIPQLGNTYAPYGGAVLTMTPPTASTLGSGCPGSTSAPTLLPFGRPWLGNTSYALDLQTPLPGSTPALVTFGFQPAPTPLPGGCTLQFAPVATQFALAADGFATTSLAIPFHLSLHGVQILAQGAVLDPAAAHGFALSAGLASLLRE